MNQSILLNEWNHLQWYDPEPVLLHLRRVEIELAQSDLPKKVRNLRTPGLRHQLEQRAAAIFTHGLARVTGTKVMLAPVEASDYDFVTTWPDARGQAFCSVQLKEWVPEELNPSLGLNQLLRSTANRSEERR